MTKLKKVKWKWDWGVYVPFCPYCNEPAYEEDHCVFCEKEYIWVDKSKERILTVGEYTVCQASNNHITIAKDGKMVMHASCTKKKSDDELREMVKYYEELKNTPIEELIAEGANDETTD